MQMTMPTIPYDLMAERTTLGSMLLEREAIIAISSQLLPEDFYLEKHGLIYEAMLACYAQRIPPDLATVSSELRKREHLDLVGGVTFLSELLTEVPTAVHVEYYASHVARTAILRRLIESGGKIAALGYETSLDLEVTLNAAEETLFSVTQRQHGAEFIPIRVGVQEYFDHIQRDEDEGTVPTGLVDLDSKLTGGFRPGQLILLAARPGMGKSGLALSIAYHLGVRQRRGVAIVSLEMSKKELIQRFIAMHTGLDNRLVEQRARQGDPRILDALGIIAEAPIAIDDRVGVSIFGIRSEARRLALKQPLDLLIVDYLQLLVGDATTMSRVDEVTRISRQLKLLARELNCPVIALSQLSRAVEQRAGRVPQLSDLRDSGSLEQDADIVLFIYRADQDDENEGVCGRTEIHVAKQRNGPVGIVLTHFDAPTTHFRNLSHRKSIDF
ncbi:MAG: replicative DNA helicase [Candidatus Viridilinea halotolerans]|uniref:Replicative DNA helicase n=1 Tax=Candidatus Viridilinea halotolerans TaxID=2491704 RepID=A0A426U3P9_9CHLR|nr:MAG: replicative DNA helicase [Candidatus Viridilinea halotolerans]